MFCQNCGAEIGTSKFCPNCGVAVNQAQPQMQQRQSAYNRQQAPVQNGNMPYYQQQNYQQQRPYQQVPSPVPVKPKKPIYTKWWFWLIIAFVVIGALGNLGGNDKKAEDTITQEETTNKAEDTITTQEETTSNVVYEIKGEELGEYGRKVILNEKTDLPAEKYLYKLPAGTYEVTTDTDKMASFFIVKDEINHNNDNPDYPEELNYVSSEGYLLTAGDNDFNGHAKKSVTVELAEDESFQIVGTDTLFFTKIN